MNTKGKIKLNYPEEFRIACKINNLSYIELLQFFIDHVSFYAFIGGHMEQVYLWATTVSIDCKELMGKSVDTVTDPRVQEISLKYIRQLANLSADADFPVSLLTIKSISLMRQWADEMLPLTDYLVDLTTDSGELLKPSFDFNLLCRMNGIDAEVLLQYFIDHISLAREKAVNLFEQVKTDPSTAILLFLVSSYEEVKNKIMPHQDIYREYGFKLLKLDQKQKQEKIPENRLNNYYAFYREWYQVLNKEIN